MFLITIVVNIKRVRRTINTLIVCKCIIDGHALTMLYLCRIYLSGLL